MYQPPLVRLPCGDPDRRSSRCRSNRAARRRRPWVVERLEGRALLAAGALDTTFGHLAEGARTGTVFTPGAYNLAAVGLATQSDGKIVVASSAEWDFDTFSLTRFNPDGSLDSTFGASGSGTPYGVAANGSVNYALSTYPNGFPESFRVRSLDVQPDDKIVIAGSVKRYKDALHAIDLTFDFFVARINADGAL